ncbi:Aste57867_9773 [Aphanomyces stellatus]|uniref:Aste57867_9773 protein n=1 Tax=Aphanomyces stellatus TaxID=120398 RepID=A0A485KP58_9STRA|nr:hypothetical protein As57867_009734 [Aphanomyces stellatus]VFT86652.1 Aste57867_9773 [Aphanomyces stellatus]
MPAWPQRLFTAASAVVPSLATFSGVASTYGGPLGVDAMSGNCGLMASLPSATKYHVALNDPQYNTGLHCGQCVQVRCTDRRCQSTKPVVAQVTDRCPECSHGDLDMTWPLFQDVTGFTTDKYAIAWAFVDCPVVPGGIQVCAKSGSSPFWLYVQPANTVAGVKTMAINGGRADPFPSNYYFMATRLGVALSQTKVEMTSWAGETIQATVALTADACTQLPQQFTKGLVMVDSGGEGIRPSMTTTTTTTPSPTTVAPLTTMTRPPPTNSTTNGSSVVMGANDTTITAANESTTILPPVTFSPSVTSIDDVASSAPSDTRNATVQTQVEAVSDTSYVLTCGGAAFALAVVAILYVVRQTREYDPPNDKQSDGSSARDRSSDEILCMGDEVPVVGRRHRLDSFLL